MTQQMLHPTEEQPQSATTTTTPEEMPVPHRMSIGVAEASRKIAARPAAHFNERNWGILVASCAILAAILVIGMVFSSLNRSVASTTNAPTGSSSSNTNSTSSSTTTAPIVPHQTYSAALPAVAAGDSVDVKLVMKEELVTIASGITYHAWTFNGTVPGPIIHVRQGQMVHVTLINQGSMAHSIDFHAAQTPWNVNYQSVEPGKSFSFSWRANYPGVFMYHCGTPTVIYHMANGMYGTIIVDPANGWGSTAQEYALVQSEFYTASNPDGTYSVDSAKMMSGNPDYVVFNGYANQYQTAPLTAKAGQKVRLFVLNAGPTQFSAFHVIGAIFSDVYIDGNPANHMVGNQTVTVPPGGGVMVELTMPEAGLYPFVTHSFANASKGAVGMIKVVP